MFKCLYCVIKSVNILSKFLLPLLWLKFLLHDELLWIKFEIFIVYFWSHLRSNDKLLNLCLKKFFQLFQFLRNFGFFVKDVRKFDILLTQKILHLLFLILKLNEVFFYWVFCLVNIRQFFRLCLMNFQPGYNKLL